MHDPEIRSSDVAVKTMESKMEEYDEEIKSWRV